MNGWDFVWKKGRERAGAGLVIVSGQCDQLMVNRGVNWADSVCPLGVFVSDFAGDFADSVCGI